MKVNQAPLSSLATPGTAEYRFLDQADRAGDGNRLISESEIRSHAKEHPQQADLFGPKGIQNWIDEINRYTPDKVQPWVKTRVRAAFAASKWKNGIQRAMVPLAEEADLNQADIRYIAKQAEPEISADMWSERAMVHVALAQRTDLTQGTAQFILDSVYRGAGYRATVRSVEEAILNNASCRPFLDKLKFHELG